ncbi:MAG: protein kinase [Candidatus Melainabacteria bacterium]|nr:protein kinase [Candidatus Melainabacteria bacterium]
MYSIRIGGRYDVLDQIGQGGAGMVYRCHDSVMDCVVAVKVLTRDTSSQEILRFHQEAKATARLDHPNIIKILDFGEVEGKAFLVLEYVEGKSLEDCLRDRDLDEFEILECLQQICHGLRYAHGKGVLHRDIKPGNVLVMRDASGKLQAKVSDFGLAKMLSSDQFLTDTGASLGSPAYMSPESANGDMLDQRSDIYSIGCVMFELLTGRLPFEAESVMQMMLMRTEKPAPKLSEVSDLPFSPRIEEIVGRCLELSPEARYKTMDELCERLDALETVYMEPELEPEAEQVEAEHGNKTGYWMVFSHSSTWPAAAALLVLLGLVGMFVYFFHASQGTTSTVTEEKEREKEVSRSAVEMSDLKPREGIDERDGIKWTILDGVATDKDLSIFKGRRDIANLKLVADDMAGRGMKIIESLPLKKLNLKQCLISEGTMTHISKVPTLEELYLTRTVGVTREGIDTISALKNLRVLCLENQPVTDEWIPSIARFKSLEDLSLRRCGELEGSNIDLLATIPGLHSLTISYTQLKRQNLPRLAKLANLRYLGLAGLDLMDSDIKVIAGLPLEELILDDNNLTPGVVPYLCQIKSLRKLSFPSYSLKGKDWKQLRKALPKCSFGALANERNTEE